MPPLMPDVHVLLETCWPIVPKDDMAYKGPFRNINTSACPTNISQNLMMNSILVLEIQGRGGIKSCPTTMVRTLI